MSSKCHPFALFSRLGRVDRRDRYQPITPSIALNHYSASWKPISSGLVKFDVYCGSKLERGIALF